MYHHHFSPNTLHLKGNLYLLYQSLHYVLFRHRQILADTLGVYLVFHHNQLRHLLRCQYNFLQRP